MTKKPNLIIVGAPKCGTTSIHAYLKQHPDIFMPNLKETRFFGLDRDIKHRLTLDEYLCLFKGATNEKIIGEATPGYLLSKNAASEIKEFNPKTKIVIALRNPVDMIYALHSELHFHCIEPNKDFKEAISTNLNKEENIKNSNYLNNPFYKAQTNFCTNIGRYIKEFGMENIHIIIFDDLKKDIKKEYKKLLNFLEVDDKFVANFTPKNQAKTPRFFWINRLLSNKPRWLDQTLKFFGINQQTQSLIRYRLVGFFSKDTKRPPMDPVLYRQLQNELKEEVKGLSKLLARDLTHWSKSDKHS